MIARTEMEVREIIPITCDCGNKTWNLHLGKMWNETDHEDVIVISGSCSSCGARVVYQLKQPPKSKRNSGVLR